MTEKKVIKLKKDKKEKDDVSPENQPDLMNNGDTSFNQDNQMPNFQNDAEMNMNDAESTENNGMIDPNINDSMPSNEEQGMAENGNIERISDIFNKITPKDQETVISYAESKIETTEPESVEQNQSDMQEPMQNQLGESIVLKKGQIKKLHEQFGINAQSKDNEKSLEKKTKTTVSKSPFDKPKFK